MSLGRSFFALYCLIIVSLGIINWVLDEFWSMQVEQDVESYTGYKTVLRAVEEDILEQPVYQWPGIVEQASLRYALPMKVEDRANIHLIAPDSNHIVFDNISVYYDDQRITLFHVMEQEDKVLVLGPVKSPTRPRTAAIIRLFIIVSLGLVILVWIWPISRDLSRFDRALQQFTQGNFNAKVLNTRSSVIRPIAQTFNKMAGRISSLVTSHKELTNAVAHELRTPLARSRFSLEVLKAAREDIDREKYLHNITNDINELEALVKEMLVYASFENEQPNLSFSMGNLTELLRHQVHSAALHFDGKLEMKPPESELLIEYDPHFLNRAVSNLIENAITYTKDHILVSVSADHKRCQICVEDNGDGVDDEFKKIIFDAFSRFDASRGKDTGGLGLGLAITNKIMIWHHGSAKIEDSPLGGAKFILTWPRKQQGQLENYGEGG
ncbi:two-component sensor histidine kinase [Thalassotalea litorea]|uniref:histidine kinase n=1 Tax=Thalassotalea litorea TaxID=2020715 RepID=A0A5R9IFG0_9GAMM|nr:ATP-binding protein [Thalassotalea litorea]TLU61294.1 two-component sensor histidine kinase [Thalassotalea litorea]